MPSMPIGQVMRAIVAGDRPRSSSRWTNFARLLFEPIRPQKEKSPRRRTASTIRRSSACSWVRTRKNAPGGACRTSASIVSTAIRRIRAGQGEPSVVVAGNSSSRGSNQSTSTSSAARALAIARPTWPAPCSCSWNSGAASGQRASASAASGAKASVTAPPQHCPSEGPSAKWRSSRSRRPPASSDRAAAIAFSSRWPPPIVPTVSPPDTSMRVPRSRGAEPCVRTTSTTTAARPSRSQAPARSRTARSITARSRPAPRSARAGSPRSSPAR